MKIIEKEEIANYVGYEAGATEWFTVTQEQINQFADCTLDHQFIHVDPEAAKKGPFGVPIAHGFLTLSMLSHFAESTSVVINNVHTFINSGFDKIRFVSPVKVNSKIRAVPKIIALVERKPGQFRIVTEYTVEIEGEDRPALVAEWISVQIS
jgi:acyl dehydratase